MEDRSGFFFRVGRDDTLLQDIMGYFQHQGRGKLSRAIRDGLRLFWDLSQQRTDVLIELFPFVREAICPPTPDTDDMERRIADAVARRLEGKLQQQSNSIPDTRDYGIPAMKKSGKGIGAGIQFSAPLVDDDDTMVLSKSTAASNGVNFMASFANLMD